MYLNAPLLSLFSCIFFLNYFGYYFEGIKLEGVTIAKIFEFLLIFFLLCATLLRSNNRVRNFYPLVLFYLIIFVSLFRSGAPSDFLRKEYIVFYFGIFYFAGYSLSGPETFYKLYSSLSFLFLFVALIGVIFFIFGIDYKLEVYSQAEANFFHPDLGRPRATSFLYNPQAFGMVCVMAFIMNSYIHKRIMPLIGLYFSYSRSSVISLVFGVLTLRPKKIAGCLVLAVSLYLIFAWLNLPGFSRYLDISQYLEDVRVVKFAIGISTLFQNISTVLFGVPQLSVVEEDGITFSDNAYIYLALKGGLILLGIYLFFLYRIFILIRKNVALRRVFLANVLSGLFTVSFAYVGFNFLFLLVGSYIRSSERDLYRVTYE